VSLRKGLIVVMRKNNLFQTKIDTNNNIMS